MKVTGFREQILDRTLAFKLFSYPTFLTVKYGHVRSIAKQWREGESLTDESSPMTAEPMLKRGRG
jgi:hypothetical protein